MFFSAAIPGSYARWRWSQRNLRIRRKRGLTVTDQYIECGSVVTAIHWFELPSGVSTSVPLSLSSHWTLLDFLFLQLGELELGEHCRNVCFRP